MTKDTNLGYRQMKLDDHAYNILKIERERLRSLGQHASFSDAFRSLLGKKRDRKQKTPIRIEFKQKKLQPE
jgi:predicted CopG family antitoxin